jgi:hypothetical protein
LGPKLRSKVEHKNSVERGKEGYEHPVEHEWHERRNHETEVNHAVGGKGEPTVLSVFGDCFSLRLFRSRNGTTGIFSSDANAEEESEVRRHRSKNVSQTDTKK